MEILSRRQEADILGAQLAELDKKIDGVKEQRAKVRYCSNQLHARTSVLPPETLSLIFKMACDLPSTVDPDEDICLPVTLSSVSVRWREVARATPSIWTRLCIHLKSPVRAPPWSLPLMALYFEHLANQSMSLRLHRSEHSKDVIPMVKGEGDEFDSSSIPINTIFQFIAKEHPTQVRALFIDEFTCEWPILFFQNIDQAVGLPNLEWIHIGWDRNKFLDYIWNDQHLPLPATLVPHLTNLSLGQTSSLFLMPYGQITDLRLEDIAIDRCFEIIMQCPNLVKCRVISSHHSTDPDKDPPSDPVTFGHTTCLGWSFGLQDWDISLFKYFAFPALERFICEEYFEDEVEESDTDEDMYLLRKKFFSTCPKLAEYERITEGADGWSFMELCETLPDTIEELYVHHFEVEEAEHAFQKLTHEDDSLTSKFPRLRVLDLQGAFWAKLDKVFVDLINMLDSRRHPKYEWCRNHGPIEELGLRSHPEEPTPLLLTKEQKARLREFVNKGLKITTSDPQGNDIIWSPMRF